MNAFVAQVGLCSPSQQTSLFFLSDGSKNVKCILLQNSCARSSQKSLNVRGLTHAKKSLASIIASPSLVSVTSSKFTGFYKITLTTSMPATARGHMCKQFTCPLHFQQYNFVSSIIYQSHVWQAPLVPRAIARQTTNRQ